MNKQNAWESLLGLSEDQARRRRREWNRQPLQDLFPRIPESALERVLDICIAKNFTYNLSESRRWSARHLDGIVIAHVRHKYSGYDKLIRDEDVERFEARRRTADQVWKVLKDWCPWNAENELLEPIFRSTLLPKEERDPDYDPMDLDDSEYEDDVLDDPMDIDG